MGGRRWTPEEDQYLEDRISVFTADVIARKLNRSYDAVVMRMSRLGISGFRISTEYIMKNQLCRMMGVNEVTVKYWMKNGLKSTHRGTLVCFKQDWIVEFFRDHPDLWNSRRVKDDTLFMQYEWYQAKRSTDKAEKKYFWSDQDVARLLYFRSKGFTEDEIAEKMGRSRASVSKKIQTERKNGKQLANLNIDHWTEDEIRILYKMKNKGCAEKEIVEAIGRSRDSIASKWCYERRKNARDQKTGRKLRSSQNEKRRA